MSTPAKKVQVLGKFMNGLSAYDLAVKHGFKGTEEEWLASLSESGASVKYVDQTLSDEQKVQARANIDVPSNAQVQSALQQLAGYFEPKVLPDATTADNGKFLQVVDGKAAWITIQLAEDGGF